MGRIESGSIAVGDEVTVLPSGIHSRVRRIGTHEGEQASAGLHASVTLFLEHEIDVSRGDMLVRTGAGPTITRTLDATVCWLSERPLDARRNYTLRHTTREVRARVDSVGHLWNVTTQQEEPAPAALNMNDIGRVALTLAQPVFTDAYTENRATGSFILIDDATNNTVAAGMIA
jgi:sulfate adenylyltransferase subunit 1